MADAARKLEQAGEARGGRRRVARGGKTPLRCRTWSRAQREVFVVQGRLKGSRHHLDCHPGMDGGCGGAQDAVLDGVAPRRRTRDSGWRARRARRRDAAVAEAEGGTAAARAADVAVSKAAAARGDCGGGRGGGGGGEGGLQNAGAGSRGAQEPQHGDACHKTALRRQAVARPRPVARRDARRLMQELDQTTGGGGWRRGAVRRPAGSGCGGGSTRCACATSWHAVSSGSGCGGARDAVPDDGVARRAAPRRSRSTAAAASRGARSPTAGNRCACSMG